MIKRFIAGLIVGLLLELVNSAIGRKFGLALDPLIRVSWLVQTNARRVARLVWAGRTGWITGWINNFSYAIKLGFYMSLIARAHSKIGIELLTILLFAGKIQRLHQSFHC